MKPSHLAWSMVVGFGLVAYAHGLAASFVSGALSTFFIVVAVSSCVAILFTLGWLGTESGDANERWQRERDKERGES